MTTRPRRVLVTLESRATFGYSLPTLRLLAADPAIDLLTLVTGSHLMAELGHSADLYRAQGIGFSATVPMTPEAGPAGWAKALGHGIAGFAQAYQALEPDIILVSGDRIETFGLTVAAAYMGLPIAHIQAGDKSGHVDDAARMAMAKFVHVHLAPGADAAERLRRLGEEEWRIFDVGAPQLDDMVGRDFPRGTMMIDGRPLDLAQPYLLLLQHPLMVERDEAFAQMEASLRACLATGLAVVWIYPNSDLGFRDILKVIEAERGNAKVFAVANLERDDYLTLLANTACLVGNSSSGPLEAPTLKVPVINIGDRQRGRPQAANILNCAPEQGAIARALTVALTDSDFAARCKSAVNPFGNGGSSPRIAAILRDIPIDKRLLDKRTVY